jgi:hypothetical protein
MASDFPFGLLLVFVLTVLTPLFWFFRFFLFGRFISYPITNNKIKLVLFNFLPIEWVSLKNIKEIKVWESVDYKHLFYYSRRWENRFYGNYIIIEREDWMFFRFIILSPENPAQFIAEVKNRLPILMKKD